MPKTPQIMVTFSPSGKLQAEVPGPNGSRQVIPLPPDQCHSTLLRLLRGEALSAAQEAWAIMQAHRTHKSYEDQLDTLSDRKYQIMKAKRQYSLVESQIGLLPQVKTTKSGRASTTKTINSPSLNAVFADL